MLIIDDLGHLAIDARPRKINEAYKPCLDRFRKQACEFFNAARCVQYNKTRVLHFLVGYKAAKFCIAVRIAHISTDSEVGLFRERSLDAGNQ